MRQSIHLYFFLFALVLGTLVFLLGAYKLRLGVLWGYFFAVNLTLFLLYGYDKLAAKLTWLRVPEAVLNTLAFAGGTPLGFVAQKLFSHKTLKASFRSTFMKIVYFQLFLLLLWGASIIYFA